ncbi:MAG: helix-turn-helix domain-containing protein [Acholeplasmataceae bacterium]
MNQMCKKFVGASKLLSKPWVGLIIFQLLQSPKRFSELETGLEISAKVLSEKLRGLEKEGIVNRKVFPTMPIKVEYTLTKKGYDLKPVMTAIEDWSQHYMKE